MSDGSLSIPPIPTSSTCSCRKRAKLQDPRLDERRIDQDRGVFMISVAAELAEMHPQTLRMYERTKGPKYLSTFETTLAFIESKLVDWEVGEWYESISAQGQPQGDKASPWKAGYHNGRAMIECIETLKAWKN